MCQICDCASPSQGPSGPPWPSEKRQQCWQQCLFGQTSTEDSKKKLTLKNVVFFSVKWNSLFDFVTSFLWFCVPSQGPSGPPRPPEKRQQPRMYIKLSGQTSTKDLRSILLLHEFDSKKIFTIIKIIGRPLNLLFLTFDFFSLRASKIFHLKYSCPKKLGA